MPTRRLKTRCRSAPPFSPRDLGEGWQLREDGVEIKSLYMDVNDLAEFSSVEVLRDHPSVAIYLVDNDKILKLFSYLIDVSVMVANMDLAGTKVPVPRVLRYGQSGNCSYMLMEYIPHPDLRIAIMDYWGCDSVPWQLTRTVDYIVRELASLGLTHNDLVPRNILVDTRTGIVVSIVDWDSCTPHHTGGEYARMIRLDSSKHLQPGEKDWYHVFLRHSFDRTGEEIAIGYSDRHPKLWLHWPLMKSKASQIVSPLITDPRHQSFSRQKRHPIRGRKQ